MSAKGWPISARSASLQTIEIALADYKPHPRNPNTHPGPQLDALGDSLDQFEQVKNIVVWRGHYIAGHGLAAAATRRGLKTLAAVDVSEWDEGRAVSFMLADNRLSDMAIMDETALTDLLASIDEPLEIPGFDEDFLKSLDFGDDEPKDAPPQIDRAAELQAEWGTALGQVWRLGAHRLAVGDCTDRGVVEAVMEGDRARYGMHDPPYGINVVGISADSGGDKPFGKETGSIGFHGVVKTNAYRPIRGDDKPFDPTQLLPHAKDNILWGANYYADKLEPKKGWIVWDKKGREDWRDNFSDCELAWSSLPIVTKIFRHTWMGMVQEGKREKRIHPTQKPVQLFVKIMGEVFKEDGIIIDFYLGSGTTLIACENLGRRCRGIEIDPGYAAVTLQRYLDATGERGELVDNIIEATPNR